MSPATILITSASGRTSSYVLKALLDRLPSLSQPPQIRLLVHNKSSIQKVVSTFGELSPTSFVIGDYLDYSSLSECFRDVDVLFYNGPAFHPNETAMGINVINAAKQMGVKHFVYSSVLHPYLTNLLNHKAKLGVEEYLTESGLPYTILQPSSLMQNIPIDTLIKDNSSDSISLECAYNPRTMQGFLYLPDLAEIAASILLDPELHLLASYPLVGENISLEAVSAILSEETGRPATCILANREHGKAVQREKAARMYGEAVSEWCGEAWERMVFYYDKRGIPGNTNIARWLLGREPTTWKVWVRSLLKEA
ncbi:NAD-P-binding protein [Heliocybe sulcata]|uniref:NAD-P-binding protein n=1 Tax=Heliocybe sulcata TaxID=5364 RepID=A0A5C3MP19_9AGAM|nr:NAD-P-binding protein [Heliocybe sulcata]